MREFFRGWRRKAGVIALGMACAFMAGWGRSLTLVDHLQLPYRSHRVGLHSEDGRFICGYEHRLDGAEYSTDDAGWYARKYERPLVDPREYQFGLERLGFQCWAVPSAGFERSFYFQVPYWSIVISFALLSARLIFIKHKPRPKPTTKAGSSDA
jgi:hypothetical protein